MHLFKFREKQGKDKDKPGFMRRMSTLGKSGSPSRGRKAMLNAAFLSAALAGNVRSLVGVEHSQDGSLRKYMPLHENVKKHVQHVFSSLNQGKKYVSREKFAAFLKETQCVQKDIPLTQDRYNFQEFYRIWSSVREAFCAVGAIPARDLDTSRPISNYFISSSHNTYLEGNQLSSKSSAEAYRTVLRRGCRCIEIDVWNGPTTRTPSRSPAQGRPRNLSVTSIPQFVSTTIGGLRSPKESGHLRSLSAQPALASPDKENNSVLDTGELFEHVQRTRASSSSSSGCRTEPVVHHRGTMTSTVGFREVCKAIRESAFVDNPLPIIISLEVGAEKEQQEAMVEIMKEEWNDLLLDKPLEFCNPHEQQPRLEDLKNKILIKVKRLDESKLAEAERGRSRGINLRAKPPICEALAALAIYTHSEHYEDEHSLGSRTPSHIFSLSEDCFLSLAADSHKLHKVLAHNRDFLMRIYPKGLRIDSSNPDPSFHWRRGVQMVAMNWQKTDEGMMINEGMFAGSNGWVLKPEGLLGYSSPEDAQNIGHRALDLRITILAGQFLPLPKDRRKTGGFGISGDRKLRPRVKVELHAEKRSKAEDFVRDTGPASTENPTWGYQPNSLDFLGVKDIVEELSFVRFKVEDVYSPIRSNLIAWACVRLDRLQPGYRFLDLLDPKTRQPVPGQLFIKVQKKSHSV